jgi:hypothetical protein
VSVLCYSRIGQTMGSTFESITFPAATNLFWPLSGLFNSVFRLFKCQLLTGWDCHLDPCCFGLRQQPPDMGKTISDRLSYLGSCSIFSFKCYGTTLKWANLKYKEWRIAELTIQNPPTHNVFPLDKKKSWSKIRKTRISIRRDENFLKRFNFG